MLALGLPASYYLANKNIELFFWLFLIFFMFAISPLLIVNEDIRKIIERKLRDKLKKNVNLLPTIEIITSISTFPAIKGKVVRYF